MIRLVNVSSWTKVYTANDNNSLVNIEKFIKDLDVVLVLGTSAPDDAISAANQLRIEGEPDDISMTVLDQRNITTLSGECVTTKNVYGRIMGGNAMPSINLSITVS